MDLLQKMFLLLGQEKNVIYSKLVNNPFKETAYQFNIYQFIVHYIEINIFCDKFISK